MGKRGPKPIPPQERFWRMVDKGGPASCWVWTGKPKAEGYGQFNAGGREVVYPHRYSWELNVGPIPEGLHIDHLCRNRMCVNPAHLEPVTCKVNLQRGLSPTMALARMNVCSHGHDMTDAYVRPDGAGRSCRVCKRRRDRQYKARRKVV